MQFRAMRLSRADKDRIADVQSGIGEDRYAGAASVMQSALVLIWYACMLALIWWLCSPP